MLPLDVTPDLQLSTALLFSWFTLGLSAYQTQTVHKHLPTNCPLEMVNTNRAKELQNVLPNGNPFAAHICYAFCRDEACVISCRVIPQIPT